MTSLKCIEPTLILLNKGRKQKMYLPAVFRQGPFGKRHVLCLLRCPPLLDENLYTILSELTEQNVRDLQHYNEN